MWQIVTGIGIGVYIGTYYNCRPTLEFIAHTIKSNFPEVREDNIFPPNSDEGNNNQEDVTE